MAPHYNLADYLYSPEAYDFDFDITSESVMQAMLKMASHFADFTPIRWHYLKKIRNLMISEGKLSAFDLRMNFDLKPTAYMHDDGVVYISLGLLVRGSSLATLGIFIHELCHIKLSQSEAYDDIKALQKKFKAKFGSHKQCELMSPIEIFANILTIKLMGKIEETTENRLLKKRIAKLKKVKERAFLHLTKQIKELKA